MRRTFLILGAAVAVGLALFWLTGGLSALEAWAVEGQRAVQDRLAGAVRAIKTGQPGALALLLGVCFGYGVLHAVGPGHGKVLIGGYGMGRRVRSCPCRACHSRPVWRNRWWLFCLSMPAWRCWGGPARRRKAWPNV